jgi:NADH:ubiquinone oxidoreductase subunit 5 (subunit L)/multisubunit Na+/H+ antiporter MnhA subunit
MDLLIQFAWLIPLLPLLAAAAIGLIVLSGRASGDAAEPLTARLASGAVALALLHLLALDLIALNQGLPGQVMAGTWFSSGSFTVPLSFTLDALSLPIATLVAAIAFITQRFSVNYMHREAGFHRFFLAMSLFSAGMLLIVLAGNAVLAFAGWELAGASSFLLIGYAYERPTATGNALRAFVTNRIGDAGFILGIALAAIWLGTVEWSGITAPGRLETMTAGLLALGFIIAALAKSAQVPFSPWLGRALEGPTPSSAIFYGALMVHVGVYLTLRLEPLLVQAPAILNLIAFIGLATALYGYFSGLAQTDVKSTLIFATTTQVGLMFLECGLGLFTLAAWHLGLHASWRAYQMLASPSYMHLISQPARPAPNWLAGCQRLYTAALQRFWLEGLGDWLLVRPTQGLARDMRDLDDRVVSRLVGMPEEARVGLADDTRGSRDEIVHGRGLAGAMLEWVADRFYDFERRLVMQESGSKIGRLLGFLGSYLLSVESLLERPRYLLLLIMATFVVIL